MQTSAVPGDGSPPVPRTYLIAQQVARLPGVADVLLARHTADHLGHCRECSLPQAGPVRWPCTLVAVARLVQAHYPLFPRKPPP